MLRASRFRPCLIFEAKSARPAVRNIARRMKIVLDESSSAKAALAHRGRPYDRDRQNGAFARTLRNRLASIYS